jgi:hypothetical protein
MPSIQAQPVIPVRSADDGPEKERIDPGAAGESGSECR